MVKIAFAGITMATIKIVVPIILIRPAIKASIIPKMVT